MKRFLFFLFLLIAISTQAQVNMQVHYDFGKDREYIWSRLEMYKADKWGDTHYFVDYDYDMGSNKYPSGTYMEIARTLKFWDGPLSAQIEYDGGFGSAKDASYAYPINSCWLGGLNYGFHNSGFTKTLNLELLYKHIVGKQESAQFTTVWGLQLLHHKLSVSGFADFWLEDNTNSNLSKTSTVFISQPQLWYNFTEHFSAGSQVEFSNNYAGTEGFRVRPTLGIKWEF